MIVVGIDPSSFKLAITYYDTMTGTLGMVAERFRKQTGEPLAPAHCHRAAQVIERLEPVLNPKAIVWIEEPVVGRNVRSTILQTYISGAVQAELVRQGHTVHLVNNRTWKSEVVHDGGADKDKIGSAVQRQWPKAFSLANGDQDLIDSAGICLFGECLLRRSTTVDV